MTLTSGDMPYVFAGAGIERLAAQRKDREWLAAALTAANTRFVPMLGDRNLVAPGHDGPRAVLLDAVEARSLSAVAEYTILLGELSGQVCFALALAENAPVPRGDLADLRQIGMLMQEAELALLGYARALTHWHRGHGCCSRCGAATEVTEAGHQRTCPRCKAQHFPRLDPAVIVLVTHDERCLLARQAAWAPKRYATLAGFVEPGESLEAAVQREVWEETDVRVSRVSYQESQPWPFPSSLMIGFRAEAETTTIFCRDGELEHAAWFTRDDITRQVNEGQLLLSPSRSISYRLIRDWFEEEPGRSFGDLRYVDPFLLAR